MLIKVDTLFFTALRDYLVKRSDIRLDAARSCHAKVNGSGTLLTGDNLKLVNSASGLLGESKAYSDAAEELDKLIKELEEKFAVEEEGS